ncbi:MAG: hypothetical protein ACLKAO_11980 [Alkaliphilus sp.]
MLKHIVEVSKEFLPSINIAYDLNNDEKVKSFIPTISSIGVIEDILLSTSPSSTDRARILIGAYGKGKSHMILVLTSLLSKKDKQIFEILLKKIKEYNIELYNFAIEYLKSDKKLLPIVISGSSTSLIQSFLSALQTSLKSAGLNDFMPDTHFKAARNMIIRWESEYTETYNKFKAIINEPTDSFVIKLLEYDVNAYKQFEEIYPTLTAGSTFNPFAGFDVVDLYEGVVKKLSQNGYDGIYVIYDEFSKYLEANIKDASVSDIKMLQDFAEKCNRSGNKQMHLMLISHKDIANYIDKLPKQKVDGWKGVSERFKHIALHNDFAQMYEIMSAVIKKLPEEWEKFCDENNNRFLDLIDRVMKNGLLDKGSKNVAELVVKGCFPLHPISAFILPRLSEKNAQNERTLFTFLSSPNRFTLSAFIEETKDDFSLLTPDYIYDYFEPLFKGDNYNSEAYKMCRLTSKILKRVEANSLQAKVVKTIALIYMVEQFENLPPTVNTIVDTFIENANDVKEIQEALKELVEKKHVIYVKRSNDYLKLKESSGINIQENIEDVVEKNKNKVSVKSILNDASFDNYLYPTRYNDEKEIIRYFDFKFIDSAEFFAADNWSKKIEKSEANGVVYAIIPKDDIDIVAIKKCLREEKCKHSRVLFIVPDNYTDIDKTAYEYNAVKILKDAALDDEILLEEYEIYVEDLEEVILDFVYLYVRPETNASEYYYMGEKRKMHRKAHISELLSEICEKTYCLTPVINNESINKNFLPSVAINSRNKLVSGLLENELESNLGLQGFGQDVSMMRSTLIRTGILLNEEEAFSINLEPQDPNMRNMLKEIVNFFERATSKEGKSFRELYDILLKPEHRIGIKKGVIPIYVAAVLHCYKKYVVIKNRGTEVRVSAETLSRINENPDEFLVCIENWNKEKADYIAKLSDIFSDYIIEREKKYNAFSYIANAMSRWYMQLPRYTKEMKRTYCGEQCENKYKKANKAHGKFLKEFKKPAINAREFLFEKVFEIYSMQGFNIEVIDKISTSKRFFDNIMTNLQNTLIEDVKHIISPEREMRAGLISVVRDWCDRLQDSTKNHLFSRNEDKLLKLMLNVKNDEIKFINQFARTLTGLRITDWNEDVIDSFIKETIDLKKTIEMFNSDKSREEGSDAEVYRIAFVSGSGEEVVKTFNKIEYTSTAKLLLSEVANSLEEMGESISQQEKRQVLMELIKKTC